MDDRSPFGRADLQTVCLIAIASIACIGALKFGQAVLAPIVLGLTLATVLTPAMRLMARLNLPHVVGALGALVFAVVALALIALWAGPIMMELVNVLPRVSDHLRTWMSDLTLALRGLEALEGQLAERGEEAMEEAMPTVIDALWLAPNLMAQALIALGTLFFCLLTRSDIYDWLGPRARRRLTTADRAVSHYFVTIAAVNATLGMAVAAALTVMGVPDPMVWGAAAFLLNFVLYLGPAIMVVSLLIAGMTHFSGGMVLLPPAVFLVLNLIEAQFVTPTFVGRRLSLNPLAVFLAIVFGLWLWGPVGGIVALPILVWAYVLITEENEARRALERRAA
ncbi:AI-2E family transporter [uncultured Tateyamaria sp.]|uniref:AI-2E family transporter n=1 Tax=uncultured Tateyamaria sp. TaxID=455651 RepID=UPI00262FB616|nr:AI-2E family transporter [uncultured Tateyamaria sp.]